MKIKRKFIRAIFLYSILYFIFSASVFSAPHSVAIFVNGDQNCCASNMTRTWEALERLGIEVKYSAWNSITAHNMGSNSRIDTTNFIRTATDYFNSLPQGTDVYLIGHSFGGDSILQFLSSYRRSHVNFRLVAILDAVGGGGIREVTTHNSVPSTVDYFFNRWQKNAPWPVDIGSSGSVECHASVNCNQKEQSFSRGPDGKTRTKECTKVEACPGAGIRTGRNGLPFYFSGVKKTRLHHSFVPTDPFIQEQLIGISRQLVLTQSKSNPNPITASYSATKPDGSTVLFIRPFNGEEFGAVNEIKFSSSDSIRGWSWDGSTASYAATKPDGSTVLFIRPFNGEEFGAVNEIKFSSSDSIRGWSWDGSTASYAATKPDGSTVLFIRPFNGEEFGAVIEIKLSSSDSIRGWSWDGSTASYAATKPDGSTVLFIRPFNGEEFGVVNEIKFSSSDSIKGWSY